jgi:antitoxin HicB
VLRSPIDIASRTDASDLETFEGAGLTRTELARRLGKDEKQVRRILDPMHGTDIATLEAAISAMGNRLVIGLEAAG